MKLTDIQKKQLEDVVKQTIITRGKNAGQRKDDTISIDHFDMRSFNKLLANKLVAVSDYHHDEFYATDLGYQTWLKNK